MRAVAAKPGIGAVETVRTWVRKAPVDEDRRPGVTSEEAAEIKPLKAGTLMRRVRPVAASSSEDRAGSQPQCQSGTPETGGR